MQLSKSQYRSIQILGHVLLWAGYLALVSLTLSALMPIDRAMIRTGGNLLFHLILAYTHLYILIPQFLIRRKWVMYSLSVVGILLVTAGLRMTMDYLLFQAIGQSMEIARDLEPLLLSAQHLSTVLLSGSIILLITLPIRLLEDWQKTRLRQQELENRKLEAELRFLKTQVNPHFLFNTLNNIYSLAFTGSEQTATMILKLSEMMRYMIYDCEADVVPMDREIQYVRSLIELQQIKTEAPQQISFEVTGEEHAPVVKVAPLLFAPVFENAFKHGNLEETDSGWLTGNIDIRPGRVRLHLANSVGPAQQKHPVGGIGLENIRKRLQLRYPDQHTFHTQSMPDRFEVSLELELTK